MLPSLVISWWLLPIPMSFLVMALKLASPTMPQVVFSNAYACKIACFYPAACSVLQFNWLKPPCSTALASFWLAVCSSAVIWIRITWEMLRYKPFCKIYFRINILWCLFTEHSTGEDFSVEPSDERRPFRALLDFFFRKGPPASASKWCIRLLLLYFIIRSPFKERYKSRIWKCGYMNQPSKQPLRCSPSAHQQSIRLCIRQNPWPGEAPLVGDKTTYGSNR